MQVLLLSFLFNNLLIPRQTKLKWNHRGIEPLMLLHSDRYIELLHALIGVTHELFPSVWLVFCAD